MVKLSSARGAVVVVKEDSTFLAMEPNFPRVVASLACAALFGIDAFLRFTLEAFLASPPTYLPRSSFIDSLPIGRAASGYAVLVPFQAGLQLQAFFSARSISRFVALFRGSFYDVLCSRLCFHRAESFLRPRTRVDLLLLFKAQ